MSAELSAYIQEWFKKADNDLRNAEILLNCGEDNIPYDTLCFHCQQAMVIVFFRDDAQEQASCARGMIG